MSNQPTWFNESNYADFLAESSILWEMNVPYQKQKFENRKKMANFERETAIRKGRLKAELTRDLYQAKAKGMQMRESIFDQKVKELSNNFLAKLLSEAESKKNPLKAEKRKMRPEVDAKDRDRDRKREDRREEKQSGLANVIIVKNNKLNKVEIITKADYNAEAHTVLKGKVKKLDKGNVTKRDLNYYSGLDNFMNTKTSIKLLGGRVERNKEEPKKSGNKQSQQSEQPQPPHLRAPKDGKEITDPDSTYPDWDHTTDQFILSAQDALNSLSGKKPSPEYQQLIGASRTLGDAMQRFTKEIFAAFPAAAQMKFQKLDPVVKTSKQWSGMGVKESTPNATILGSGNGEKVGISIKIGEQVRPAPKGEAGLVLNSVMMANQSEPIFGSFDLFVKDFVQDLRKNFASISVPTPIQSSRESSVEYAKRKSRIEQVKNTQKTFITKAADAIEQFFNGNEDLKTAFLLEALTGNLKFDGKTGSAQMMFAAKKDGTDAKAIPLTQDYAMTLAKSKDTNLTFKFVQAPNSSGGFLASLFQKITPIMESAAEAILEIERVKDQLNNPLAFLQMFELQLVDAHFNKPITYSEFYAGNSDTSNIVTFNPGTHSEEEIQIPVQINYNPEGDSENVIEKGADAMLDNVMEEYFLINDYLVESVKNNTIDLLDALIIMEDQYSLDEKRNYRKEYDNYHSKPKQRANRSKRVLARRKMEEKGKVSKGDGKDVNHKDGNPQNNSDGNLEVMSKSKNRSMNEDHGAGFEGTPEAVDTLLRDTPFSNEPVVGRKSLPYLESRLDKKLKTKKK
jgi:hypothetical protein